MLKRFVRLLTELREKHGTSESAGEENYATPDIGYSAPDSGYQELQMSRR